MRVRVWTIAAAVIAVVAAEGYIDQSTCTVEPGPKHDWWLHYKWGCEACRLLVDEAQVGR